MENTTIQHRPSVLVPRQSFSPTCPPGSSYYACTSTPLHFVGCCASDPCTPTGCSDGNLYPLSFDLASWHTFPDGQCASGSRWYTCTTTTPTFMGCCKSDACASETGCPASDLTAGSLDVRGKNAVSYVVSSEYDEYTKTLAVGMAMETSSASGTDDEVVTMTTDSASPSAESTPGAIISSSPSRTSSATIAGAAAGGAIGVFVLMALLLWFLHHRRKSNAQHHANLDKANIKPLGSNPPDLSKTLQIPTISAPMELEKKVASSEPEFKAVEVAAAATAPPIIELPCQSTPHQSPVNEMDASSTFGAPVISPIRNITSPFPPLYPPGHHMNTLNEISSPTPAGTKGKPHPLELSSNRESGVSGVPSPMSSLGAVAGSSPATTFSEMGA